MKLICEHIESNLSLFHIHRQSPNNIQSPHNISYLSKSSFSKEKENVARSELVSVLLKLYLPGASCAGTIAISPGTLVIPAAQNFQSYHTPRIVPRNFYCAISFWKINICSAFVVLFPPFPLKLVRMKRNRPSNIHSRLF